MNENEPKWQQEDNKAERTMKWIRDRKKQRRNRQDDRELERKALKRMRKKPPDWDSNDMNWESGDEGDNR